jgi:hypothetical protein
MPLLGLGSALSIAKESTFGTASAGTYRRLPFLSESLSLDVAQVDNMSLRGGTMFPTLVATRQGRRLVTGDVQAYLYDSGAALLFEAMLGSNATTGSGPYTHTATIPAATSALPSYTIQVGLGGVTGSSGGFTRKRILGAVVDSWEIAAASGEPVTLGVTWAARDAELAAEIATTGSEPSGQSHFDWRDATVAYLKSDGTTAIPFGCVTSFTISGSNNLNSERFCLGSTLMSVPIRNGSPEITGTVEIEFPSPAASGGAGSITDIVTEQLAGSVGTLTATFDNTGVASNTVTINARVQFLPQSYPTVSGPEQLTYSVPFRVIRPSNSTTDADTFSIVSVNGDNAA